MQVNRWMKLLVVGTLLVLGSGCATRNMLSDGAGGKAMLAGNDPVSYHVGASPVKGDPKITAELAAYNRSAVPFNVIWFPGKDAPVILPEILTAGKVLEILASQ